MNHSEEAFDPPQPGSLDYRLATNDSLFELLAKRATEPLIPGSSRDNPLRRLPMVPAEGFVPALFDAWARVGDVLTFYQERIANEGYVATATEPFSLQQLVRAIGYEPRPPLSARTVFAFALSTAKGAAAEALIPAGTPIGAAPPPDGSPAPIFETAGDMHARGEWNAVPLLFPDPAAAAEGPLDAARLTGSDTTVLQRGAPLVIRRTSAKGTSDIVTTIVDVQPDAVSKSAFVQWLPPVDAGGGVLQFVAFRASTGLFGAKAPEWRDLSPAIKARSGAHRAGGTFLGTGEVFASLTAGAPQDEDVVALGFADGALHALTARRLMRWDGAGWRALMQEPRGGMLSFAAAPGALYLGTSRGDVRVSRDGGTSWSSVGSAAPGAAGLGVAVHALVVRPLSVPVVIAGTDRGVAVVRDDGSAWTFVNDKLGGVAATKDGRAPVAVVALALRDTTLLAATSAGLWTADVGTALPTSCSWVERPVRAARPDTTFTGVAFGRDAFAASDGGLFRCDATWGWQRVDDPAIAPAPRVVAADTSAVVTAAQNGIAVSTDGGTIWSARAAAPNAPACAVALDPGSALVAYAEPLGDFPPEWDSFALEGTGVDLDRLVPSLADGAQAALVDGAPVTPLAQAARVAHANAARRKAFGQTALVTHVEFQTPLDTPLARFGRRTTRLHYDARVFGIAPAEGSVLPPVVGDAPGDTLHVDGALTPFPAGRLVAVRGRAARIRVTGSAGGVHELAPNGVASASALSGLDCLRVVTDEAGAVYVLTGHGVWQRPAGSTAFAREGLVLPPAADGRPPLLGIAVSDAGAVVTTTLGVFRRGPEDMEWTGPVAPAGLSAAIADPSAVAAFWAGGPDGIWHSDDLGATWQRVTEDGAPAGSDSNDVAALVWDGATLLAGTATGVAIRDGGRWRTSRNGLANRNVIALAAGADGWFAGTDGGGVYRSTDRGASWRPVALAIPSGPHSVRALAIAGGSAYAAVRGYGVLVLGAHEERFRQIDRGIGNDVRGLTASGEGVWAAARSGTVLATPAFVPQEISLHDLGRVEYSPATGDALDRGMVPAALRVDLTTQLKLPLPPKAALRTVEPHRRWLLSGQGIGDLLLRTLPDASGLIVSTIASFIAQAPPRTTDGTLTWQVVLGDDGLVGTFDAKADEVEYAGAHDDDPVIGEEAIVVGTKSEPERGITTLSLKEPLSRVYDGRTAVLLGNCAHGSHGMSSSTYEPIGSGDASRPNQSFALKRANLSMFARALGDPEPQITVIVRPAVPRGAITSAGDLRRDQTEAVGVQWSPIEHLTAAGPRDRVFTVREDQQGRSTVEFGDGEYGARLPTGIENVVAMYRTGNGPSGNIAAGSPLQLRKRNSALASVTNPVPASGGTPGEEASSALATAQRGLRSLERIVSAADLEDFALARGGIAKAKLRIAPGRPPVAHLTLAANADGDPFTAGGEGAKELLAAIRASGGASLAVVLHGYRSRWVRIAATLSAGPAVPRDPLVDEAAQRLRAELAFERRALGEDLPAARVIEILQRTSGVEAVTLTAFHDAAWSPVVAETIPGSDDRSLIDGEMLVVLDPDPAQLRLSVVAP